MDERLENRFSIRRIFKSTDEEYLQALFIYNDTTPNDIKTNTNEISYWINNKPVNSPFELLVFILYLDNSIIGLAMICYVKKQKVMIYDYIALIDQYRINTVFFPFVNLMQNYVRTHGYDINYYVVEISDKNEGKSIDKESLLFKKLICLEGFGMVPLKYYTLPLGLDNFESSFAAYIYLKSNDAITQISKETYISIVDAIYYEYYLTWYSAFLLPDELILYKQKIDKCYKLVLNQVSDQVTVNIQQSYCSLIDTMRNEKTYGYLPSQNKKNIHVYSILFFVFLIGPVLLVFIYNYIFWMLKIPISSVSSIIGSICSAMVSALSAFIFVKKKS